MATYQPWLELILKSLVVLAVAAACCAALRKAGLVSAAGRHLIWSVALAALLALPLLSRAIPAWRLPLLPVPTVERAPAPFDEVSAETSLVLLERPMQRPTQSWIEATPTVVDAPKWQFDWAQAVFAVWLLGAAFVFLRLAWGARLMRRITEKAERLTNYHWSALANRLSVELNLPSHVTLYASAAVTVPVTWGVARPVVVLPLEANHWSREWQRIVLLHEFAHIKRRDCLTQMLASAACALYWFNPLVWRAARQLRVERELACDDCVLAVGTRASDYASCLVALASSFDLRATPALAVGMADSVRCSELESRVRTMLDPAIERRWWSARRQLVAVVCAAGLLLPLAALQAVSQSKPAASASAALVVAVKTPMPIAPPAPAVASVAEVTDEMTNEADPAPQPQPQPQLQLMPMPAPNPSLVEVVVETPVLVEIETAQDTKPVSGTTGGLTAADLVQLKMHDVTPEYIESVRQAGYADVTIKQVVQMKIHGITQAYIREAQALAGERLALRDVINMKVAGLTAGYINEMKQAGFDKLTINQLTQMRHLGIAPDYVAELKRAGLENLTANQLTQLKSLGVTESYVRQAQTWGAGKLSVSEIVRLKAHGVKPEDAQEFNALGFDNLSLSGLTQLKIHGVTSSFIKEMRALGFDKLTLDDAVKFKIHGVTADYVKKMRAAGFNNISSNELLKLKIQGLDSILLKQ